MCTFVQCPRREIIMIIKIIIIITSITMLLFSWGIIKYLQICCNKLSAHRTCVTLKMTNSEFKAQQLNMYFNTT